MWLLTNNAAGPVWLLKAQGAGRTGLSLPGHGEQVLCGNRALWLPSAAYDDPCGRSHLPWPLRQTPLQGAAFFRAWIAFLEMNEQVKAKLAPKASEELGGNNPPHSPQPSPQPSPTRASRRSGGTRDLSTDWLLLWRGHRGRCSLEDLGHRCEAPTEPAGWGAEFVRECHLAPTQPLCRLPSLPQRRASLNGSLFSWLSEWFFKHYVKNNKSFRVEFLCMWHTHYCLEARTVNSYHCVYLIMIFNHLFSTNVLTPQLCGNTVNKKMLDLVFRLLGSSSNPAPWK